MVLLDLLSPECDLLIVSLHVLITAALKHLQHELAVGHRCIVLLGRHLRMEPLI